MAFITIIILIALVVLAAFSVKWAQDRSKSNKTSLFGNMNGEYRNDPIGKMTPAALEGLEEAEKRKAVAKQRETEKNRETHV